MDRSVGGSMDRGSVFSGSPMCFPLYKDLTGIMT